MVMSIREIKRDEQLYAIVFSHSLRADGVRFLTPDSFTLQLGLIEHPSGKQIRKHSHNPEIKYHVDTTQEFIYVEKGILEVTIYDRDWSEITKFKLRPGDFYLHVSGGHGFKVIKKCRIFEIKQGPYPGDKIAKLFDSKE